MEEHNISANTNKIKQAYDKPNKLREYFLGMRKAQQKTNEYNVGTEDIIHSIYRARKELEIAHNNFEFAQEQEEIDYYIYKIKAAETKYRYLIKQAKEKNVNIS